ncbi:MAG TPA: PqqD family protein [Ignavibacteria bacterium]|nr:HPr-rel-A system PqqD family protein [Bacteroidota bacterium]HRI83946.1 PqqD family protein [Ignavibacteria bacterium]HRJ98715.1 PqqD family protein [Ignavibacteria bacterium]
MKIKNNIAISDSGFIFNPATGDSFSANPVGQKIFKMLQTSATEEEITADILETYQIDKVHFEKDFYDFINVLKKYKLLEEIEKD